MATVIQTRGVVMLDKVPLLVAVTYPGVGQWDQPERWLLIALDARSAWFLSPLVAHEVTLLHDSAAGYARLLEWVRPVVDDFFGRVVSIAPTSLLAGNVVAAWIKSTTLYDTLAVHRPSTVRLGAYGLTLGPHLEDVKVPHYATRRELVAVLTRLPRPLSLTGSGYSLARLLGQFVSASVSASPSPPPLRQRGRAAASAQEAEWQPPPLPPSKGTYTAAGARANSTAVAIDALHVCKYWRAPVMLEAFALCGRVGDAAMTFFPGDDEALRTLAKVMAATASTPRPTMGATSLTLDEPLMATLPLDGLCRALSAWTPVARDDCLAACPDLAWRLATTAVRDHVRRRRFDGGCGAALVRVSLSTVALPPAWYTRLAGEAAGNVSPLPFYLSGPHNHAWWWFEPATDEELALARLQQCDAWLHIVATSQSLVATASALPAEALEVRRQRPGTSTVIVPSWRHRRLAEVLGPAEMEHIWSEARVRDMFGTAGTAAAAASTEAAREAALGHLYHVIVTDAHAYTATRLWQLVEVLRRTRAMLQLPDDEGSVLLVGHAALLPTPDHRQQIVTPVFRELLGWSRAHLDLHVRGDEVATHMTELINALPPQRRVLPPAEAQTNTTLATVWPEGRFRPSPRAGAVRTEAAARVAPPPSRGREARPLPAMEVRQVRLRPCEVLAATSWTVFAVTHENLGWFARDEALTLAYALWVRRASLRLLVTGVPPTAAATTLPDQLADAFAHARDATHYWPRTTDEGVT